MNTSRFHVDSRYAEPAESTWRPFSALGRRCLALLRRRRPAPAIDVENTLELRREYRELVARCCERHGVDPAWMRIKALSLGYRGGKEVYVVLVTVVSPAFEAALHLAHLAPAIEKRVADAVGSTWLGDYSQFSGVWLHWPEQMRVPDEIGRAHV